MTASKFGVQPIPVMKNGVKQLFSVVNRCIVPIAVWRHIVKKALAPFRSETCNYLEPTCKDLFRWKSNKLLSLCGIYFLHNHPFRNRDTESKSDPLFNEVVYGKILRTDEFPSQRDFLYTMTSILATLPAILFLSTTSFFCFLIGQL